MSDDFPGEQYAAGIQVVLEKWSAALRAKVGDVAVIGGSLSRDMAASSLNPSQRVPLRAGGPLRIERRVFGGPLTKSREQFLRSWAEYLSSLASLEVAEMEIYGLKTNEGPSLRVDTELRYDFVGTARDGAREQRVGSWSIAWVRDEQQRWNADRWLVNPEVRSRLTGPGFTDITARCVDTSGPGMEQLLRGIDHWRTVLDGACGIDVYGNHGISVGDIDGSGHDSFYVCQPSGLPNRLYRNRGDGTFEDITAISGVGILDGTASALFADFLNRGRQDLLVVRTGGPLLFSNQGNGRFEPRPDAFQFARPPQGTFTSVAAADYNRDGLLDVYFCVYSYYQGLNQYQFPSPYYDAQNGPPNFLFRNRGDGTFEDVTVSSGMDRNNNRFSFAAAWCDFDNDGWPDLYVANDFGRKNLYRSNRDGTFADIADAAGVEDYGPGMSACWLDYDNDGLQDVYVANMWLEEGKRITADDRFLPGAPAAVRALYQKHNAGNSLYRNNGRGGFDDKTNEAGSAMARWSWSCAAWDFDHDGYEDLYIANGFVSGPNHYDLQSFFWRQVAQRSLAPPGTSPEYEMAWNAVNELVRSDYSWSGYERNVFYANNRDGTFSDVSGVLGLDFRDDSRAFAMADFNGDGRPAFVLKNRTGPQLRILRNDLEGIGNSVSFRLRGHSSNFDAIGATVTIEGGAPRQTKFVSAGSGFASQHTKELFFGVGESKFIAVSVRWPNGIVERHQNIPANNRVEIEEGRQEFKATAHRIRQRVETRPAPLAPPALPPAVSTWLVAPLFGPNGKLTSLKGETVELSELHGGPTLLTFFRLGCEDSEKSKDQLRSLQAAVPSISSAGLGIAAVAVNGAQDRAAIGEFARSALIGLPVYLAADDLAGAWNILYRYMFDRRRDMAFPMSFLLDKNGAIIRLYQGPVSPAEVVTDWTSAPSTPEETMVRAHPFQGPYYGNSLSHNYFTFGIAFVQYGYIDAAQAAFQRAVDANAGDAGSWFNLGTIHLNRKMYTEARRCLAEAVRLNPEDADAWNNLGMISGEEQKYDLALEEFQRAALANPNYLLPVQNMLRIYQYQARPADAQKALEQLIAKAPGNADLHLGLGMALVAQNRTAPALEELQTAVRLRPDYPDALNDLGALLLRIGRIREALVRLDECRRIAPDFDRAYINTAVAYKSGGEPEKARELLAGFLARHPDNDEVRKALEQIGTK